jgi:hypothetical protein
VLGETRVVHVGSASGPQVVAVNAPICDRKVDVEDRWFVCARIAGHEDDCWLADPGFVDQIGGAVAIVATPKGLGL